MDMQKIPVKKAIYLSEGLAFYNDKSYPKYLLNIVNDFAIIELGQDLPADSKTGAPRIQVNESTNYCKLMQ
jgi:hypothetical protein